MSRNFFSKSSECLKIGRVPSEINNAKTPALWIRDKLERIRIRGSGPVTYGSRSRSGSGSCFFHQCLTRCQQNISFLKKCFCLLLLEGTVQLHQSAKIKSQTEVKKQPKSWFFLFILLVDGRIWMREAQKHTDPQHFSIRLNKMEIEYRYHTWDQKTPERSYINHWDLSSKCPSVPEEQTREQRNTS